MGSGSSLDPSQPTSWNTCLLPSSIATSPSRGLHDLAPPRSLSAALRFHTPNCFQDSPVGFLVFKYVLFGRKWQGEALPATSSGFSDPQSLLWLCVCPAPEWGLLPRNAMGRGAARRGCGPPVRVGSAGHGAGGCIRVFAHPECVGEQSRAGEAVEDSSIALAAGESVWAAAGNTAMSLPWHWALSLSPTSWVWAFASPHLLLSRQKANTCALSLAHPCCAQVAVSPRGCCRAWCRFLFIFIPVFFGKKIFSFVSCIQVPKPPVTSRNAQVMLE